MSRPFSLNNGKNTFAQFKDSMDSSEYIHNKKMSFLTCKPRYCTPNNNLHSQSNYLNFKKTAYIASNPCNSIDSTQLYINLITQLDLSYDETVVTDLSGNTHPVTVDPSEKPYLKYNIDPSGNLFGDSVCGIDNWQNYVRPNPNPNANV